MTGGRCLRIITGLVAANLVGVAFCFAFVLLFQVPGQVGLPSKAQQWFYGFTVMAIWPSLVLVPMAMGIVAAYFWRNLSFSLWKYFLWWIITSLISPFGAYFAFKEGAVCLLIGFPILFVCGFAGVLLGRLLFKSKTAAMNLSVIPMLLIATLAEGEMRQDQRRVVEDRIRVNAPAAQVWNYVVSFPAMDAAPNYWLNKIGLPSPLATTCQGAFVGAARECIFSGGLVFKERVSEITPARLLTFEIVEQPSDPELLGHLTLHRGQFQLIDNNDGTTTLIGRSWYTLHMRPLWYFDWWTRDVTSHVHLRVMEHIKALSERK
jgi:Polyketide cyclase / dehydrase and lipid transport